MEGQVIMMKLRPHQERIVNKMSTTPKGQVIVPTGGGKTMCMIKDAQREFNSCSWDVFVKRPERKTFVVVSPRILLAQQHCDEFEEFLGFILCFKDKYYMYIVEILAMNQLLILMRLVNGIVSNIGLIS